MRYTRSTSNLEVNLFLTIDLSENDHHIVQEAKEMTIPKMTWALNSATNVETAGEDVNNHIFDEVLITNFLILFSLESVAE